MTGVNTEIRTEHLPNTGYSVAATPLYSVLFASISFIVYHCSNSSAQHLVLCSWKLSSNISYGNKTWIRKS
jgi:hypothetical protein